MNPESSDSDAFAKGMSHYDESATESTPDLDEFQFNLLSPYLGENIIELGAGPGRISSLVAKRIEFQSFVASEPSPQFFSRLRDRLEGCKNTHVRNDLSPILIQEFQATFDTVFSVHVMEHIEDDLSFLQDCLSLAKPGGRVITLVPALPFLYSALDSNIGHFRRYNKRMLADLCRKLDAEVEELFYSDIIGVVGSFIFLKVLGMEYQSSTGGKARFLFLARIYSKWFIPVSRALERWIRLPIGLNLTLVIMKRVHASN